MRSLKRPGACAQQAAARAAGRGASDCASAYIEKGDFGDFILVAFTVKIGLSALSHLRLYHICYLSVREGPGLDPLDGFREPWAPDSILC